MITFPTGFNYNFISHKVKLFVDWAIDNYAFRYLLKTDDDAEICLASLCCVQLPSVLTPSRPL